MQFEAAVARKKKNHLKAEAQKNVKKGKRRATEIARR